MGDYKSDDGFTITNGNGYMGIHSACVLLNEKIKDIEKLKKENELLRETVAFYGSPGSWDSSVIIHDIDADFPSQYNLFSGGKKARETLKAIEDRGEGCK